MRRKVLFLLTIVFVCVFSANAQTKITVDESQISAFFADGMFFVNFNLKNSGNSESGRINIQILDQNDKVLAKSLVVRTFRKGDETAKVPVRFAVGKDDTEEILWYRLKYDISTDSSANVVSGIVSFSEIVRDAFNLRVLAAEDIFAGMNYRIHVIALNPITAQPVKDVNILGELRLDLDIDELKILAKGKTNSDGFATLDFQIPFDKKLDGDGEIMIAGEKNGIRRQTDEDIDIRVKSFVYLNTDKPIYQPNQKLFVRGLYLNPLKKPLADRELEFTITDDEEDETVFTQTVKTSLFGISSVEWQIPENIKLGKYKIEVENDDGQTVGLAEFKITRYDLPNFTVETKNDKTFYLPNDNAAKITVSADYLFDKPVAAGTAKIVELDEDDEILETIGEGTTDKNGKFIAAFDLREIQKELEKEKEQQFKDLKFIAYFTDATTGKTEQKRFDLRVSKQAIHVYFTRYAADANPILPFQFYVSTFYADGTPAVCDVVVKGNYENTVGLNTKLAEAKTNFYGVKKVEITVPKPFSENDNEFNLEISAADKQGRTGNFYGKIEVDEDEKQLRVLTDNAIYRQNETIKGEVYSTVADDTLMVDIVKNSGVIFSQRIKLSGNRTAFQIPFQPDFKGELTVFVYSLNDTGYDAPRFIKSLIFPSPEKLDFNMKSLKTVYRPNEEAKISFNVRNGAGEATETAFGILVLDKAIEERAATENSPDNFAGIRKLLGTDDRFGNLTRRDLKNLDLRKPITDDLQLAAEFLLINQSFELKRFETSNYKRRFSAIYEDYFKSKLKPIEEVLKKHSEKTGEIPIDQNSLREILRQNNVETDSLRDAWGMNYDFEFKTHRNNFDLRIITAGADKSFRTDDDFTAAKIEFQRYRKLQYDLNLILNQYQQKTENFPTTKEELIKVWKDAEFDFESLRDDWNRPFYIESYKSGQNAVKPVFEDIGELDGKTQTIERTRLVTQETIIFKVRSSGEDDVRGNYDDFDIAIFAGVLKENILDGKPPKAIISKNATKNLGGAIRGTLVDPNDAVIPGFNIEAVNQNSDAKFTVTSNDTGEFIFTNLPSGTYDLTTGGFGFQTTTIKNIVVSPLTVVNLRFPLEIGAVSSVVEITADVVAIDATSSSIQTTTKTESKSIAGYINTIGGARSTPRVREYFPETLVWQPEIITDKMGRAEVNFKLADSLTTWKLYAVGSTKTGEIEMVEREFQTFQPFFAELEPPKILTEGDEISLPVPVRNYTAKRQKVSVEMAKNSWSNLLNGTEQKIEIAPNSTTNAIFNFRASEPIADGKQKVTALAADESDAIEKTVTVKPNGREIVVPQSGFFEREIAFNVNFPADAFPRHRKISVKIYPNMFAHIAESVEGLLERPHGCGEQTTSSTYPNLLILKYEKQFPGAIDSGLKTKAQKYLGDGYKRLLNYQTDTGFGYWNGDSPDIALTAYVLRFLHDAGEFIKVDETVVRKAENWLLSRQNGNGSFENSDVLTAYVARSLSLTAANDEKKKTALQKSVEFLKNGLKENDDAFVLANLALTAVQIGDSSTENAATAKLSDNGNSSWTTQKTPFNGWGKAAEIETTALVLQAFLKSNQRENFNSQIGNGLLFLLKNKDEHGVWFSTQTTVNVLDAMIFYQKLQKPNSAANEKAEIFINGVKVKEFDITGNLRNPFIFDASQFLNQTNKIEIKGFQNPAMAQIVSTYYTDWQQNTENKYFDLTVDFDKTTAKIGEEILCRIRLQRKEARNGMILAEIGIPPGADVDRASLETAVAKKEISRYDILPDKIIAYLWADRDAKTFDFKFKSRYGINAQNSASVVYDYYNAEAKATVAPLKFIVGNK